MFGLKLGKLGAALKAGTGSAGVTPLFARDYAATGTLGADATFARASSATYVDSDGVMQTASSNEARFDYSTGSRALLMEPAATNLTLNSREFTAATWGNNLASVVKNETGIFGDTGAWTLTNSEAVLRRLTLVTDFTVSADTSKWTFSAYIKKTVSATSFPGLSILFRNGAGNRADIICNTDDGLYQQRSGQFTASSSVVIDDAGDFWRYSLTVVNDGTATALDIEVYPSVASLKTANFWSTVTGVTVIDQIDVVNSAVASSPIVTTGTATARAAESLSYSGIAADNETRAVVDAANIDVDDWDGVVDATLLGADNSGQVSSITVYTTGERPA